ncbi:MAG: endonuclease/exonuclease/phosphatase family protein [Candidatus Omnitrophica bacterium]|nr:endonuclease/exonuclease/phosphatase family protein [Candidatus Omnitrophota bacterium]
MKTENKIFTKLNRFLSLAYLLLLVLISLAPYWPYEMWWLANLIQISPLWGFGIVPLVLLLSGIAINDKKVLVVNALSFFVLVFPVMGFQVPLSLSRFGQDPSKIVKVATVDLGETANLEKVSAYITEIKPDIVAFQEAFVRHRPFLRKLLPRTEWDLVFEEELALASRIPIIESKLVDRRMLDSWGVVAAKFVLKGDSGPLHFFNIWLESPRKGIEAIIDKKFKGISEMKKVTRLQETESFGASKWTSDTTPVLVTGDFNQLATSPIYRDHWSHLRNAFSDVGFGFGYTKYTSVHGVRLDHFLYSSEWSAVKAVVGPDLEADHRPLRVDFVFKNSVLTRITEQSGKSKLQVLAANKKYLIAEDFEGSTGMFSSGDGRSLSLDRKKAFSLDSAMRIAILSPSKQVSAGAEVKGWLLEKFPRISFAYQIPEGMPAMIRVKTRFDQWICLGATEAAACPSIKGVRPAILRDDGNWHEFHLDVNGFMKGILPGLKSLYSVDFYIPRNRHLGDTMLIDAFRISEL